MICTLEFYDIAPLPIIFLMYFINNTCYLEGTNFMLLLIVVNLINNLLRMYTCFKIFVKNNINYIITD